MSNDVQIVVTGNNRTAPMWTELRAQLAAMRKEVSAMGRELRQMAEPPKIKTRVDDSEVDDLDVKLRRPRRIRVKVDVDRPSLPGSGGAGLGVLPSLGELGKNLRGGFTPIAAGVITNTAVAAAPAAGAATAAAGMLGAGAGGLALGIAGAFQDPLVKQAAADFKQDMSALLRDVGKPFVDPVRAGIREIAADLKGLDLASAIKPLAATINPIVAGVRGLMTEAMPGVTKAIAAAGPLITSLAGDLPKLGSAVSDMFESFADGAPGATRFMSDLVDWTAATLMALGNVVEFLSSIYDQFTKLGDVVGNLARGDIVGLGMAWQEAFGEGPRSSVVAVGEAAAGTVDPIGAMAAAADDAQRAIGDLITRSNDLMNELFGVKDAQSAVEEAMDEFSETMAKTVDNWNISTEAGRTNTRALREAENAIMSYYQKLIEDGDTPEVAAGKTRAYADELYRQARAAGADGAELAALRRIIEGMPTGMKSMVYRVITDYQETHREDSRMYRAHGGITGAASGGQRGGMTWVGEQGPELVRLPFGSTVYPAGQSQAMTAKEGGGVARLVVTSDPDMQAGLVREIVNALRFEVRATAGGDASHLAGEMV